MYEPRKILTRSTPTFSRTKLSKTQIRSTRISYHPFSLSNNQGETKMVFFSCDGCAEVLKKSQVDGHASRCRRCASVSCVDCLVSFYGGEWLLVALLMAHALLLSASELLHWIIYPEDSSSNYALGAFHNVLIKLWWGLLFFMCGSRSWRFLLSHRCVCCQQTTTDRTHLVWLK